MKLHKNILACFLIFISLACSSNDVLRDKNNLLLKKITMSIPNSEQYLVTTFAYDGDKLINIRKYLDENSDELHNEIIYNQDRPIRINYYEGSNIKEYVLISYSNDNLSEVDLYSVDDMHLSNTVFTYDNNKLSKQEIYKKNYGSNDFALYTSVNYTHSINNIKTIKIENYIGTNAREKYTINLTVDDKNNSYKNINLYFKTLIARNDYGINLNNVLSETYEIDINAKNIYTYEYEYNELNFPIKSSKYNAEGVLLHTYVYEYW